MSSTNQIDEFFTLLNGLRETINPDNTNILPTRNSVQRNTNILPTSNSVERIIFNNDTDSVRITVLPNLWLLSTYGSMIGDNIIANEDYVPNSNNISYANNHVSYHNSNSTLNRATAPVLQNIQNNSRISLLNISSPITTEQVNNTLNNIVDSITDIINENNENQESDVYNKDTVITTPPFGARAPKLKNSEPLFDSLLI